MPAATLLNAFEVGFAQNCADLFQLLTKVIHQAFQDSLMLITVKQKQADHVEIRSGFSRMLDPQLLRKGLEVAEVTRDMIPKQRMEAKLRGILKREQR